MRFETLHISDGEALVDQLAVVRVARWSMPGSSAEVGAASTSTRVLPLLLVKVSVSRLTNRTSACLVNSHALGNPGNCTGCTGALARSRVNASKGRRQQRCPVQHCRCVAVGHAVLILRDQGAQQRRFGMCGFSLIRLSFLQGCLDPSNDHVESGAEMFGARLLPRWSSASQRDSCRLIEPSR